MAYYYSNQFNTSLADNKKRKNNLRHVVCANENNVHNNVQNSNFSSGVDQNSVDQNSESHVSSKNKQIINNCIIQERIRFQIENSENKNEINTVDDYEIKRSTQRYDDMDCEILLAERRRKMKLRRRGGGSRGRAYKNE